MKTLVMTVPHSGTHFLVRYLVGVLGLHESSDIEAATNEMTFDFVYTHPNPTVVIPDIFDTCIITLRHPYKAMTTAKFVGDKGQIIRCWEELLIQQKKYKKTLFLNIDGPEENHYPELKAIADHFGVTDRDEAIRLYADDWSPVNQSLTEADLNAATFAVKAYEQWCDR